MGPGARLAGLLAVTACLLMSAPAAGAAGPPQITDTWMTGVTANAADAHATVDPNGLSTTGRVEYIAAADYDVNVAATPSRDGFAGAAKAPTGSGFPLGSGSAVVEFNRHLGALKASTAYRYRVVAINAGGTTAGPTRTFATTETSAAVSLPDNRGWEMVSPPDKNGGEIQAAGGNFGGGVLQASADGSAVTYSSSASFADGQGAPGASQYISRRGPGGWGTENITLPTPAGVYGALPDGVPYQLFSGDLGRGLALVPQRCEVGLCSRGYALRQSASGILSISPEATDMAFVGSNSDLTQIVLATQGDLFGWSGGSLTTINFKPGEGTPTLGAELAAPTGAVSVDGTRVYFNLEGNLYLRSGGQTVQVDASLGGGGQFQAATADGSIALLTKAGHLYRYAAAAGTIADLTPAGEVQGVLGISPDAGYVYFLTPTGLFLHRNGIATKVADAADPGNYPPAAGTARVAANGNLAFLSSDALTGFDSDDQSEVYLYRPAGQGLVCVSCNSTGSRPLGPASIPGAVANGSLTRAYRPRALSTSGNRLFFESVDALALTDTNNDRDVYQWEAEGTGSCQRPGGCVDLISSGRSTEGASFVDASADGSDVFFVIDSSLVPDDPGVADVYDARVGGGFPVSPKAIPCVADACQVVPGEPDDPGPATALYRPEANPPLSFPKAKKKKRDGKGRGKHRKHKRGKAKAGKRGNR